MKKSFILSDLNPSVKTRLYEGCPESIEINAPTDIKPKPVTLHTNI